MPRGLPGCHRPTTKGCNVSTRKRALVLGGGGSAGHAWEVGVLAGLSDAGVDLTDAELIVGTSAGATVAAQISSTSPAELFAAVVAEVHPQPTGGATAAHMDRTDRVIAAAADAADMRRRMGTAALEMEAASDGAWGPRWRRTVAARLTTEQWPERTLLVTAVDARTGAPVVFDRHSGVDLVDAVAASTSASIAYPVGEDRYIDGGYRRNENADLAAGYGRAVVLSPFGGRTRHPLEWGLQLATQVDELRAGGSVVETVFPADDAVASFGTSMMDLSARPPAARAGHGQGLALAEQLTDFWR